MERPIFKPPGTPVEELDTPALVVDLDLLGHNLETTHSFFRDRPAKLRPHVEAHRCPVIVHMQLAAGGTVGGVCVNTVGQAELFANSGVADIFVASQIVTQKKIARLCALARRVRIAVSVDNPRNAEALSQAASSSGSTLSAVVDINTRLNRCGVESGAPAVELAQAIERAPGLEFVGFATYEGAILAEDPGLLERESQEVAQQLLDTKALAESSGLRVQVLSAGGTHNYEVMGDIPGITEVCAGSYALMDSGYRPYRPQLKVAARLLATVTSRPEPGLAILDTGQKAAGADTGLATFDGQLNAQVKSLSAEHGSLRLMDGEAEGLGLGDKVWLVPSDIGTCTNLFDYIHAVRDGRLETVWPITARGLYR